MAVVREQRPEALAVIERRVGEVGARMLLEGREYRLAERARAVGGQVITVAGLHAEYREYFLPVFGEEMARNAGAAVVACEALLDRSLDEGVVRAALRSVTSPGRLEVVGRGPLVILDGAHNADAAAALAAALGEFGWDRLHLVVGVFADKDLEAVLGPLVPLAAVVYACRSSSPRAADPERVAAGAASLGASSVEVYDTVAAAVEASRGAAGDGDLILVTGSFYTVADARPLFVPD